MAGAGAGIAIGAAGGYICYVDLKSKAIPPATQIRQGGRRWYGEPDPTEPDPFEGIYAPSGDQYVPGN